jgi:tetratricopeptide (TPR) repeat protein
MNLKHLKFIVVFVAAYSLTSSLCASIPENKIAQGNTYYNAARYDSAMIQYQAVVDAGYESSGLFYNLGNAYFKLKDIPSAILYYEKAKKLDPTDEDILRNIDVANNLIVDKIDQLPRIFIKAWWDSIYNLFNADSWAWISLCFLMLSLISIFFYLTTITLWIKKTGFFSGLILILFTILSFGLASQRYYYTKQANEAIIFAPTITVKSSPGGSSVDLFVLHEGTKVALLDGVIGWSKIKISNGSVGWLPNDSFKGI